MSFKCLVEIFYHIGSHVSRATDGTILDGLNSLGNSPQNSEPQPTEGVLGALEVLYLQAQVPDQVVVDEGHWGDRQLL